MELREDKNFEASALRLLRSVAFKITLSAMFIVFIIARVFSPLFKDALDATGLTLLALAVLPWLGPIFESIKVAGVEAKFRDINRKLQSVEATAQEAKGISADAGQKANLAVSSALSSQKNLEPTANAEEISALAREYEELRERMTSGAVRTERMSAVVSRMIKYFRDHPEFSAEHYIDSDKIGERLAAYAYYVVRIKKTNIEHIIDVVAQENKPFNQYWGLKAVARLLSDPASQYDRSITEDKLLKLRQAFSPGTDRRFVIDQILSNIFGR